MTLHSTYTQLPAGLFDECAAERFAAPALIKFNAALATELGFELEGKSDAELAQIFAGQVLLPGSRPLALAYAAHQFGHFVPQLGDGRALLLGEVKTPAGKHYDIQLKGSGRTKYSRSGDGRAALGPVLREYLVSEAMHRLGVPTTRALAAVSTGELVYRETPLPGAIVTRVASSHLRIGTFQYLACRQDTQGLKALLDYAVERHYPELKHSEARALDFVGAVARRQAKLVAQWMGLGFIHGVMNTDNMTVSGETIDYGPCAFMDQFNFHQVYSFIDKNGRYAYGNQPKILVWNLTRLGECLVPLLEVPEEEAIQQLTAELQKVPALFEAELHGVMAKKLGLQGPDGTGEILQAFFDYLTHERLDFTQSFRQLAALATDQPHSFPRTEEFQRFEKLWRPKLRGSRTLAQELEAVNPIYIPRNHQIEAAIQLAERGDFTKFHELHQVLSDPFTARPEYAGHALPPEEHQKVRNTFCGT